jgi:hypothetical protein
MTDETLDLILQFIKQERNHAVKKRDDKKYRMYTQILDRRIAWFDNLIAIIEESQTGEGLQRLKDAIEKNKQEGL